MTSADEQRKRLRPTGGVVRALYLKSGNQCAYRGCSMALITEAGTWRGEFAHIRGVGPGSSRYDATMTNEQLRGEENLILLCPTHHTEIDRARTGHTVAGIQEMKADHEARYTQGFNEALEMVRDTTVGATGVSLDNALALFGFDPDDDEDDYAHQQLALLVDRLAALPQATRKFLANLIARGHLHKGPSSHVSVLAADAQAAMENLDTLAFRDHVRILEGHDLLRVDDDAFGAAFDVACFYARQGNHRPDLDFIVETKKSVADNRALLEQVIVTLDFRTD